ncbi:hypothetical protein ES703_42800 [subsurface metagenome]
MKEFFRQNPIYRVAFEQLKHGFAYTHFEQMGAMDGFLWEALEKIERGVMSPKAAMDWAAEELKREME